MDNGQEFMASERKNSIRRSSFQNLCYIWLCLSLKSSLNSINRPHNKCKKEIFAEITFTFLHTLYNTNSSIRRTAFWATMMSVLQRVDCVNLFCERKFRQRRAKCVSGNPVVSGVGSRGQSYLKSFGPICSLFLFTKHNHSKGVFFWYIFLPLLVFADFADIENVFFWASLGKTADSEGYKKLESFADFSQISDFIHKPPVGLL